MARSGSYDFTATRDELIKAAFRLIGVGHRGESVPADEINDASQALNIMLKAWMADGLQLWKREEATLTLPSSKSKFTLGPSGADITMQRPLRILECFRRDDNSSTDVPLNKLTMNEYMGLSDKTSTGTPVSYMYDPQLDSGEFHLWQTPSATWISENKVHIIYHLPFEDMDSATDDFDFPVEWLQAIKFGLALDLAPEYGIDLPAQYRLQKQFDAAYDKALSWDVEYGSIYFQPDYQGQR